MHAHLLGLAIGLLSAAWLPNWVSPSALRPLSLACVLAAISFGVYWQSVNGPNRGRGDPARTNACLLLLALGAGMLFGLDRTEAQLLHRLPASLHGISVTAEIEVESLPRIAGPATRFDAWAVWMDGPENNVHTLPRRLRLTWFDAPEKVRAGDIWRAEIKLRSPVGTLNHSGFDYEAWLLSREIHALGSIRSARRLEGGRSSAIQRMRGRVREFVLALETQSRGPLLALATGDTSAMTAEDWRLFRDTGTVHLMVISGLHLGLIALYAGFFGASLGRLLPPLCVRISAQQLGAVTGVLAALGFAMLCGWTLPVKRAFVMICCVALALAGKRHLRVSDSWLIALILVLAANPFASLASGFWLSFGAVAILCMCDWHEVAGARLKTWAMRFLRAQFLLTLGMAPLLLLVVQQLPLTSLVCNLFAVPITTLAVVPLVLLGSLLSDAVPGAASFVLELAGTIFSGEVWGLEQFDAWQPLPAVTLNPLISAACAVSFLFIFYPAGAYMRPMLVSPGLVLIVAVVPFAPELPEAEFRLRLLDVGQGLSVIVETRTKRLLFDAGAAYADGFSFGEAVVVPAIRSSGVRRLDELIVSHWDTDHSGGVAAVLEQVPVRVLRMGPEGKYRHPLADRFERDLTMHPCVAGTSWRWDGVQFSILHPQPVDEGWRKRNDLSCVLLIDNGTTAAVLPGDISRGVEFHIMGRLSPVHVLVAAHHGSRSSSAMSLLRRTEPKMVLVSSGWMNPFGHPHADRVCAWDSVGARVVNSASSGAITWSSTAPEQVYEARQQRRAFWRIGRVVPSMELERC